MICPVSTAAWARMLPGDFATLLQKGPFLQGFLQIRSIIDQGASATLQTVAVFLNIWGKMELLHKLELGPHFPGVVPQPPTRYQHTRLKREEITSTPPSTCGLAREKTSFLFCQQISTF